MRVLAALIASFSLGLLAAPAHAQAVNTGHLEAQLVAQDQGATPGSTITVGLRQKINTGWHTYWRNPGDSGAATKVDWTLPPGWSAGDFIWPAPHRLPLGPLVNYGFSDEVILPLRIKVPASAKIGQTYKLTGAASFLVCADICVPEDAVLTLDVPVVAAAPQPDPQWGAQIAKAVADAPRPAALTATFAGSPETVKLAVAGAPLAGADMGDAYFYPYDGTVIDHAGAQRIERGPDGLTLTLVSNVAFQMGQPPQQLVGVLALKNAAYEITATPGAAPAGTSGLGPPPGSKTDATGGGGPGGAPIGLLVAALFAFGGGLILNLMPCVFPVLSMKAASLAAHADNPAATRAQGLAFLGGVMVTFLALAGALIAARAAGEAVGWGFQLQSPAVVAALSLIMLLTALNLSGVFEIGTSVQGLGSGLASKGGLAGAAFTGALAVVVAAPCTAPFMAPALGYALTQPPAVSLIVFAALGLGMAAPFTLLAFLPKLLARFPRPGAWMETFRRALAFPMYAAAAWLVWVLAQQTDAEGLAKLLAAAVLIALGAWIYGRSQSGTNSASKRWTLTAAGGVVVVLAAVLAVASPYGGPAAAATAGAVKAGELASVPYSPEKLAELRDAGTPVFIDFTAAWCITCKVNERTALANAKVIAAFEKTGTVYMVGDWTNRNAEIAAVLDEFGRPGVPLYLVYGAKGQDAVVLPQILTEGVVTKALETAAS
jgi:thiol:disulfide interchange protein DsbD